MGSHFVNVMHYYCNGIPLDFLPVLLQKLPEVYGPRWREGGFSYTSVPLIHPT